MSHINHCCCVLAPVSLSPHSLLWLVSSHTPETSTANNNRAVVLNWLFCAKPAARHELCKLCSVMSQNHRTKGEGTDEVFQELCFLSEGGVSVGVDIFFLLSPTPWRKGIGSHIWLLKSTEMPLLSRHGRVGPQQFVSAPSDSLMKARCQNVLEFVVTLKAVEQFERKHLGFSLQFFRGYLSPFFFFFLQPRQTEAI